jgi:hypothetical protein
MNTLDNNAKSSEKSVINQQRNEHSGLLETALPALAVSGLWYYCYYLIAPWIWSQNTPYKPEDITPWVLGPATEYDGVEIYALYILVFVNIASALTISGLIGRIAEKHTRRIILSLCAAGAIIYCVAVGFIPPWNSFKYTPLSDTVVQSLLIMLITFPLIALLYYLQHHSPRWGVVTTALVVAPTCFLATQAISWQDYTYIFAPALRMINGAAFSDIYFQYDLLLSLLAAGWMKLHLDLISYQILGQASYYVVILGVYLFSAKIFQKKGLAVFLLAALVLGRMYASQWDAVMCFQVTPLRLDLWLPLLVLVYYLGPFHWTAGLLCGLLLIVHKTFGIIYSAAYIQLLLTICAIEYFDDVGKGPLLHSLIKYGKRFVVPAIILVASGTVSSFLFKNSEFPNYSGYYQKIGIGFIQIADTSFYWYVPAIMSMVVILLFRLRKIVSAPYLTAGFMLTFCAIGNSIYFFGRSHEHNILNIAIVLLFLFFFLLDLIARSQNERDESSSPSSALRKHGLVGVAAVLIVVIIVSYSGNIARKGRVQLQNLISAKRIYPFELGGHFYDYVAKVKEVTHYSSKVYFVHHSDFALYYFGGYAPVGYPNPFETWLFTKDLTRFLQGLLDNGYYLVCSPDMKQLLTGLRYNFDTVVSESIVVAKQANQASKP